MPRSTPQHTPPRPPPPPTQHETERRLLAAWVAKARRRGVGSHAVVTWVRRKVGAHVTVFRTLADGSLGCAAPCLLCQRELLRFDLRVHCSLAPAVWWSGRLTDASAPPGKLTARQRMMMAAAACEAAGGGSGGSSSSGSSSCGNSGALTSVPVSAAAAPAAAMGVPGSALSASSLAACDGVNGGLPASAVGDAAGDAAGPQQRRGRSPKRRGRDRSRSPS